MKFLFAAALSLVLSSAYGADDINITPSPRCIERLKAIGATGVNPLFLVYSDDINQSYETAYKNIESIERECTEIREVLMETKASLLFKAGFKSQAKATYSQLIKMRPDSWTIMQSAGLFYDAMAEYEQAIVYFERAKRIDNDWTINSSVARSYYKVGRDKDAVDAYLTALHLNPTAASMDDARNSYIAACKRLKNYEKCSR